MILFSTEEVKRSLFRSIVFLIIFSIMNSFPIAYSESDQDKEYQIKAAFLYNFAKFVEWPDTALSNDSDALNVCILGDDPFGDAIESIKGKTVKGKKVIIKNYTSIEDIKECHVLFICSSEKKKLTSILMDVRNLHVLTVSDMEEFCGHGGMINLIPVNNRIGFEINLSAAHRAGLNISSQLLKLAKDVIE